MPDPTNTEERLFDLLKAFETAFLVTARSAGAFHARPMAVAELQHGGDMYFSTTIESPKIVEIQTNPSVLVTFQNNSQFAVITGKAEVVRDREEINRLWKEAWRVWFPEGMDDPSLCLLKIAADEAEYWDNSGAQGLKYVFEGVKALVKGKQPEFDEKQHAKVDL
jgi:general stress protein 26